MSRSDTQRKLVYVKESDSKDAQLGLFAGQNFSLGELVLSEHPFLTVPSVSNNVATTAVEIEGILNNCDPTIQEKFWSLGDKYTLFDTGKQKTIIGIVETNGLPMGESSSRSIPTKAGLYEKMCRMNHSCVGNVHHQFNSLTGCHEIYACRNIHKGEELLTNYFHVVGKSFEERQVLQKKKWNFNCDCTRCSLEKQDNKYRAENDNFESVLKRLDEEVEFLSCFDAEKALSRCEKRLKLLEEKGSWYDPIEKVRTCYDAFQISLQLEEFMHLSPRWIQKAYYFSALCRGLESAQTCHLEKLCVDPLLGLEESKRKLYSSEIRDQMSGEGLVQRVKSRLNLLQAR